MHAQSELINIFKNNNIPLVILKGVSAAVYYSAPMNRTMGDIDFIVPQEMFENACILMDQKGYLPGIQKPLNTRHKNYVKGNIAYELHHHFSYDDLDIEYYIIDGFQHIEYRSIDGIEFPMLPKLANGLVLLAHLRDHLKRGLGLRQVIDWMMYVNEELDDIFWESEFQDAAFKVGMEKLAVTVTRMCQMYLGLSEHIAWCRTAEDHLCFSLMKDLFSYGNFGRKQAEGIVFENAATVIREMGFFHYLQDVGEKKLTLKYHYRWLKPFGWIYQLIYLLKKSFRMKRGTKMLIDLKKSSQRYDLLKKLDIL